MVTVRKERPAEAATREALLDLAYGPARFSKASERLREGRLPELALVAAEGRRIVGTLRLWQVSAGPDRPALLLGPLAVVPDRRKRGIGSTLVHHALREAERRRDSTRRSHRHEPDRLQRDEPHQIATAYLTRNIDVEETNALQPTIRTTTDSAGKPTTTLGAQWGF